jgi:glutamate/tyrosine decarboxylase-like PLP-dependent enzyme
MDTTKDVRLDYKIEVEKMEELFQLILPIIKKYKEENGIETTKVIEYLPPDALIERVNIPLSTVNTKTNMTLIEVSKIIEKILKYSVRTSHPRFFDKLYAGSDLIGQVSELITSITNTNCHTYAVAPVYSTMERAVIKAMAKMVGFKDLEKVDGCLNPGGSQSNLTAFIVARHHAFPNLKMDGWNDHMNAICFTGSQSHYSINRAAMIAGFGMKSCIKVKTDRKGCMIISDLKSKLQQAVNVDGKVPFFISATAGTTVMGGFDNFIEIAKLSKEYKCWFHIDACWGGSCIMSRKYKHLLNGAELCDSIVWNPHKTMGIPVYCSVLLINDHMKLLEESNSSGAEYLFHEHDASEYDLGDKTLQCGRRADSLKIWLSWKYYGVHGYEARINKAFDNAKYFKEEIVKRTMTKGTFLLVEEPMYLNVCFWYIPSMIRSEIKPYMKKYCNGGFNPIEYGSNNGEDNNSNSTKRHTWYDVLHEVNEAMYYKIQKRGYTLCCYNPLRDGHHDLPNFFRVIINQPRVEKKDLDFLLKEIETVGEIFE